MQITTGKAVLPEKQLKDLPIGEIKRRAAKAEGKPPPPPSEPEVAQSAAKKRLDKLRAQRKPIIEPFEYESEIFYIKRLSYQNLIDLALSISRDGHNVLNIHDESGVLAVTTAVLLTCVCNEDESAYFEPDDIGEYLNTPDDAALVSALFMACNEANPDILSTLKKR